MTLADNYKEEEPASVFSFVLSSQQGLGPGDYRLSPARYGVGRCLMRSFSVTLIGLMLWTCAGHCWPLERCSQEEATDVASTLLRAVSEGNEKAAANMKSRTAVSLSLVSHRVDSFAGDVFRFQRGGETVEVASLGCAPVNYSNHVEEVATWGRPPLIDGRKDMAAFSDLKKEYVTVDREDALRSARRLAKKMVPLRIFKRMKLAQGELVDEGHSFSYVFRWVWELEASGVRQGVWTVRVRVNPRSAAVFDARVFRIHPDMTGLIPPETAIREAKARVAQDQGLGACKMIRVGAGQVYAESGDSTRFWAVVFDCSGPGGGKKTVSIRIDAATGAPLEKRLP